MDIKELIGGDSFGIECHSLYDSDTKIRFLVVNVDTEQLIIPEKEIDEFKKHLIYFFDLKAPK